MDCVFWHPDAILAHESAAACDTPWSASYGQLVLAYPWKWVERGDGLDPTKRCEVCGRIARVAARDFVAKGMPTVDHLFCMEHKREGEGWDRYWETL